MQFQPGHSGNPAGRPIGARNKKTLAMEAAFEADLDAVVARIRERAMGGNAPAMRLCMERALPTGRGRPLAMMLPAIRTSADVDAAAERILAALGEGEINAREAMDLISVVDRMIATQAKKQRLGSAATADAPAAAAPEPAPAL